MCSTGLHLPICLTLFSNYAELVRITAVGNGRKALTTATTPSVPCRHFNIHGFEACVNNNG